MGFETQYAERKVLSILKVLSESTEVMGARIIGRLLKAHGVELTERAVRYHLKLMDERGLTQLVGRDGRRITRMGLEELKSGLVRDKVGFVQSRIELLAFRTDFDPEKRRGLVPVNISIFKKEKFSRALQAMKPAFDARFCVSDLVAVARAGEAIGEVIVPAGRVALATVCSIVINGVLLKAGVPMNSRFGGILQVKNNGPIRFVELINYDGSSLDPSEVFIRARMTDVRGVLSRGEGKILANYREIPALCRPIAERVVEGLKEAGLGGMMLMGSTSESVCEMPVELNRIGMILMGGLNPVAAAQEAGLEADNFAMSAVMDYGKLVKFSDL